MRVQSSRIISTVGYLPPVWYDAHYYAGRRPANANKNCPRLERCARRKLLSETQLFTIGHSNHGIDRLLELLRGAGVTAVADVRSQPYSQRYPHFSRPELAHELAQHELAYAFLGEQLGGR